MNLLLLRSATAIAFALLCVILSAVARPLHAQVSTRISTLVPTEAPAGKPLTITASLTNTEGIDHAVIVYRPFGESDYRRADMDIEGTRATVTLPASTVVSPSLEFYIVFVLTNGKYETYPFSDSNDPFSVPPQRTIRIAVPSAATAQQQVIFLSPEADIPLAPADIVISFSLLRADSVVDRAATRVYFDGADITPKVILSGDVGVVSPENTGLSLAPGAHRVVVWLFTRSGEVHSSASFSFNVTGANLAAVPQPGRASYTASVALESRHEQVDSLGTWYNRGSIRGRVTYGPWRFVANAFLTSDEESDRQPQNRYFLGVESPWGRAGYGDLTPSFPDLILSGKRIRGVHAALSLGVFNLQVSSGQTTRAIEGRLVSTIPDSLLAATQTANPSAAYAQISPGLWGQFDYGTYQRDLFAIRPSFGSGETWQVGFTWMKSKDDMGSIVTGSRPQENLVLGMDMMTRLDNRRIELAAQGAFSAYNSDISSGTITDERIAELFPGDSSSVRQVRDILSKFITVNENLRPLSLRRLSTAAGEASMQLNYFDNVFKFTYLYRGSDYTSFGQSFLRKDIQGYNVNDRVRLVDNSLLLTAGYERLQDNTSHTKVATTIYSTVTAAVTYAPRRAFPSITVGYNRYDNSNGLNEDSLNSISDVTNRIFLQSSYDFPMLGNDHTVSVNVASSDRSDATIRGISVNAVTFGLSFDTRYRIPLTTSIDLAMNYNQLPGPYPGAPRQRLNYATLAFQGRYEIIASILSTQAAISPSFGDFSRTVFDLGAEWSFYHSMRLIADLSYFKNTGAGDQNFVSLRYQYEL
ncbi:MAG: hypothetical protein WB699_01290 [Bacteroidota bacterium]